MGEPTMKHPLKIALNVLASVFVMVSYPIQTAQAEEVWLDFSAPEADVTLTAPKPSTVHPAPSAVGQVTQSAAPKIAAAKSKKAIATKQTVNGSEKLGNLVALDFSVPEADTSPTPIATEFSGELAPSDLELIPPVVKTEVPPPPKPSVQPPKTPATKTPTSTLPSGKTRSQRVTALRRAIIGQESGGKFYIVNPHSGALGYGQLMPANVAPWSRAALGRELSVNEFLNSPELQIKVIDHKLGQYLDRALQITGGNEATAVKRVAAIWYSGNPNLYTSTRPQFYKGYRYPSIASYSQSVLRRYQQQLQG